MVERDESDVSDGFAGTREKHIEDGERAPEFLALEVRFHVLGNEERKTQDAVEGFFEILQDGAERGAGEAQHIGERADWFRASENVSASVWEELIGVEKIRTAKHIEGRRDYLRRGGQIIRLPIADAAEPIGVEFCPGLVEEGSVALPGRILGKSNERRAVGDG